MFFGTSIQETRQMFYTSWRKYKQKQPLLPLEEQIVQVIAQHPEYHAWLEQPLESIGTIQAPLPEGTNPFLHMGLHLAIRDQMTLDRPTGIQAIYHALLRRYNDPASVEHQLMAELATCLWHAQQDNALPNEADYLAACRKLLDVHQKRT